MPNLDRRKILLAGASAAALSLHQFAWAGDASVAEIKKRGVLQAGTEAAYEPFEFTRGGKIVGYGRDLLQIVVDKMGVQLEQVNLPFQGLLPGLMANKFDIVATSVGINPERVKRFAYTRPVGSVEVQLVTRHGDGRIRTVDDLKGRVVGTQLGSAVQPQAAAIDIDLKTRLGKGFDELKLFQTYADAATALTNGQIDAALMSSNITDTLMKAQPDTLQVVTATTGSRYLCWVTRPNELGLRDFVNATLAESIANGKIVELQKKWFGRTMELPAAGYLPPGAI